MRILLKKQFILLGSALYILSTTAYAETDINIGAVSLYKDRGVDQENKNKNVRPALQGSIEYAFDNGFYVGNWNSTGKFGRSNVEIDLYAGYATQITENTAIDFGYVHYIYPNQGDFNSGEMFINIQYRNLYINVLRGMKKGVNQKDMYYNFDYIHPLNDRWSVGFGSGLQKYGEKGITSKIDYRAGIFYEINPKTTASFIFSGANHKSSAPHDSHNNRLIFGLNYSF